MAAQLAAKTSIASSLVAGRRARTQQRTAVISANQSGPKKGTKAKGAQAVIGYRGSTEKGSAPNGGFVYKLGLKNGKGEYRAFCVSPEGWLNERRL